MSADPICPYCKLPAVMATGRVIYPHRSDLWSKRFWACTTCPGVYVGCHLGTDTPLGRLANAELRVAKMAAHDAFDALWHSMLPGVSKKRARGSRYAWLADRLGIPREECHIGMFDVDMCRRVVEICAAERPPT